MRSKLLAAIAGLGLTLLSHNANAQERELIVAGVPAAPMRYFDSNKQVKGLDIEIVDHIFKKLGVKYRVELIDSNPRLEVGWKNGDYDMLLTFSYKEERAKYLTYPKESHLDVKWNFFILEENSKKITFNTLEDLKGLTIGVSTGKSYTPEFWGAGKSFLKFDEIAQDDLQMGKLDGGRIDIVPLETVAALHKIKNGSFKKKMTFLKKPLSSKPYYNTFVKASTYPGIDELAAKYDIALKKMKQDGSLKTILEKYEYSL
jgi:polar amino acid transport system substrate-binding protein